MPMDLLPGAIVVPTRDDEANRFLRDVLIRAPNAKITKPSQPWIDAQVHSDTAVSLYAISIRNGQSLTLDQLTGTELEQTAVDQGLPGRLPAVGSTGFLLVQASSSGGTIFAGDVCKDPNTGLRVYATTTKLYSDGDEIAVAGLDTGPQTNFAAGQALEWQTQRPGIGSIATVFQQSDGSGLTGGRDPELDDGIRDRIRAARANPPASGNDADYQTALERTPGLAIAKSFTYPCLPQGGAQTTFALVMRPAFPGGTRAPNATQLAQAYAYVASVFPATDSIFGATTVEVPTDVALQVSWAPNADGWADVNPWPLCSTALPVQVTADTVPTVSSFTLDASGTMVIGGSQAVPVPGMRIAFYDPTSATVATDGSVVYPVFRLKTLLTVIDLGGHKYTVTCDTSNNNSDTSYTPVVGQPCCPWAASLSSLVPPVLDHFEALGPGEQKASFFDDGLRERRSPRSPQFWPNELTHRVLVGLFGLNTTEDVSVLSPALPFATPVGTPGVASKLLAPRYLTAFPE